MIPSHSHRQSRKADAPPCPRRWRLGVRLGGRLLSKFILVASCVTLIVLLSSLDPGGGDNEYGEYIGWTMSSDELSQWVGNMSSRMDERRNLLQQVCSKFGLDRAGNDSLHRPNVWEFLINHKHHVVWCNVFKAASTSWMYNFNILAGYKAKFLQTSKQVPLQLARKRYPRPSLSELREAQNNSSTFLIVRHPLERLLSGYRDKIENALAHTYHHKLNNYIVQKYRNATGTKDAKARLRAKRLRPTFSEFVNYLIDQHKAGKDFDMHWTPINAFCTPCQIHFDIIMKFETLEEDQNFLIQKRSLEKWIRPQWKNHSKGRSKTTALVADYYSQLTPYQVRKLFQIYKYDFLLFNYTLDGYTPPTYVANASKNVNLADKLNI